MFIQGDTRSLGYSSYWQLQRLALRGSGNSIASVFSLLMGIEGYVSQNLNSSKGLYTGLFQGILGA